MTVVDADPVDVVRELKQREGLDIGRCGGGKLAGHLFPEIDDLIVKRYPVAIGAGIPMFDEGTFAPAAFTLTGSQTFGSGAAIVRYTRK